MSEPTKLSGSTDADPALEQAADRLLLVVPTFNERENVPRLVRQIFAVVPHCHVLIVDDASPDGTAEACIELQASFPGLQLLRRGGTRGLGGAYVAGLSYGLSQGYQVIGTMDADLSHDPTRLPAMLERAAAHDVVIGSRYVRDGGTINWRIRRILMSWLANRFAAWLLRMPVHDATSGYRLYRRGVLAQVPLEQISSTGYSFLVELLYRLHRLGGTIDESPIVFYDRTLGESKLASREIYVGAVRLLRLRLLPGAALNTEPSPSSPETGIGDSPSWSVLRALSLGGAMTVALLCFLGVFPLLAPMPTWDQWSLAPLWQAHYEGSPVLPRLLEPYNGHLNLLPRLYFFGLGLLTHWNVRTEVIGSFLVVATTVTLLLIMLRRSDRRAMVLAMPVAGQSFCLLQFENLMSGYPFGQNLCQLLSTLAVFLLTGPELGRAAFAGAMFAAAGATLSWGAGLAAWHAGFVVLLLRRDVKLTGLAIWLAVAVPLTLLVRRAAQGAFMPIAWGELPRFFLALIGRPWSARAVISYDESAQLGLLPLIAFLALGAWTYWRFRGASLPWVALGLLTLSGSGLIALGRSGSGTTQALASHYVTTTTPLLISCMILCALVLLTWRPGSASGRQIQAAAFLLLALVATAQPLLASKRALAMVTGWDEIARRNVLAIARGTATDAQIRESSHPVPELVRSATEVLRAHRLAFFHQAFDGEPPIGHVDRLAGQVTSASHLTLEAGAAWTIEGWAVGSREQGGPVRAVELMADGRRRGTVTLDLTRTDIAEYYASPTFRDSGWQIAVPAEALSPGVHHLGIAAVGWSGGRFPMLETDLEITPRADIAVAVLGKQR